MRKILVFEDRMQVRTALEDALNQYGNVELLCCKNVYEANSNWKKNDDIDAIILDIMMSPIGLEDDLRAKTKGGLLTGWMWLWKIMSENRNSQRNEKVAIAIFSGFLDDLNVYLESEASYEERDFANEVKRINKEALTASSELVQWLSDEVSA